MYAPGDRVRVDSRWQSGHCRTPYYLKGRVGVVVSAVGIYRNPERLAYHKPGLPPRRLYRVRFRQEDIWVNYTDGGFDTVEADLFEHWLLPVAEELTS